MDTMYCQEETSGLTSLVCQQSRHHLRVPGSIPHLTWIHTRSSPLKSDLCQENQKAQTTQSQRPIASFNSGAKTPSLASYICGNLFLVLCITQSNKRGRACQESTSYVRASENQIWVSQFQEGSANLVQLRQHLSCVATTVPNK